MAIADRFAWEAAKPVSKAPGVLRRAGLFTPGQATAALVCGTILLVGLLLLQKFGVPFGDEGAAEFCLPVTYFAILMLVIMTQKVGVDLIRLVLFVVFALMAVSVNLFSGHTYSMTSLMYAIAIYFPFVFRYFISADTFKRLMNLYINAAMIIVALTVANYLVQLAAGPSAWPNLDRIAPEDWLVKGYDYLQPIKYGMWLQKPNAFFMFEASFVSQYIGLGLIIELIFFGRPSRLLVLTAGLLLTFAGTGLVLLAACAPFLVVRMPPRILLIAALVGGVTAFAAVQYGWYSQVSHRVLEIQYSHSSAHERFIDPATALLEFLQRPDALYNGVGSGEMLTRPGAVPWPITKVTIEYGVLTSVVFFGFFLYSLLGDGGHMRIGFALLVFYNFLSGSFAVPVNAMTCIFFCTLFRVANPPPPRKITRRPSVRPARADAPDAVQGGTDIGEPAAAPVASLSI